MSIVFCGCPDRPQLYPTSAAGLTAALVEEMRAELRPIAHELRCAALRLCRSREPDRDVALREASSRLWDHTKWWPEIFAVSPCWLPETPPGRFMGAAHEYGRLRANAPTAATTFHCWVDLMRAAEAWDHGAEEGEGRR